MLPDPPKGWQELQEKAQRATDPKQLVKLIDQMNALLTEEEHRAEREERASRLKDSVRESRA